MKLKFKSLWRIYRDDKITFSGYIQFLTAGLFWGTLGVKEPSFSAYIIIFNFEIEFLIGKDL